VRGMRGEGVEDLGHAGNAHTQDGNRGGLDMRPILWYITQNFFTSTVSGKSQRILGSRRS